MVDVEAYWVLVALIVGVVGGWLVRGIGVPKAPEPRDDRRSELDTVDEDASAKGDSQGNGK